MGLKFFYEQIIWERSKSQLTLIGGCLAKRGRRFQVDGLKKVIFRGQKLYLCKVQVKTKNNKHEELFKLLVLREGHEYPESDIQLVGQNINGSFVFDQDFLDSMFKNKQSLNKIKLSDLRDD